VRLDRLVSERAGLSRRTVGQLVRRGRVTVDGAVVRDPAAKVDLSAEVALEGSVLVAPPVLALFHKPAGVHSTVADDHGRQDLGGAAADLLALGLHPVGRLDADTTGLLLFSRDGALTQSLLHPKRSVERVYEATVDPPPGPGLADVLAAGVETAAGTFTGRLLAIDGAQVRLAVTEGKHRMVRRMLANAGHPVVRLHRVAYGPVALGSLPVGAWRAAGAAELDALGILLGRSPG
jgi:pseudouridine synthase